MKRSVKTLVRGVFLACLLSCPNGEGSGFMESRPWLADRSTWSETVRGGDDSLGCWAVGNGLVCGVVGPGLSAARLSRITGPPITAGCTNDRSTFGPAMLQLKIGGKAAVFQEQTISKVRGTGIVVMEFVSPEVKMTVLNYAPFEVRAILRTIVIENRGNRGFDNVELTASVDHTRAIDGRLYDSLEDDTQGCAPGHTRRMFSSFLEPCEASGPGYDKEPGPGTLTLTIDKIPAGADAVRTQYLLFSMEDAGDESDTLAEIVAGAAELLKKTFADWREWLGETTLVRCPDQRLTDLLDDTKMLVRVHMAGPLLYHLRIGRFETARNMLEFRYRSCALNRRIADRLPMDMDTSPPPPEDIEWSSVPVESSEVPSRIILRHRWYYEYTGDLLPIREHWAYLKRCLLGQLIDENGNPFRTVDYGQRVSEPNKMYRFASHGDESWILNGYKFLDSILFPEPNDLPQRDAYRADMTWGFAAAADAMTGFARLLGDEDAAELARIASDSRSACERDYWIRERGLYGPAMHMRSLDLHQPPFTMINLNPLWIGYLKADDPKAAANVMATMRYTMNPNYVTDATETLRVYAGMQPGMFLYNLAAIHHAHAEPALAALMGVAAPTGEYAERQITDPGSYQTSFGGHRISPREGGVNADAACYYLTGLKPDMGRGRIALCPRLPFGWQRMTVEGQRLGDGKLDMDVKDDGNSRAYDLKWSGTEPLAVDFTISLKGGELRSARVNDKRVKVRDRSSWGVATASLELMLAPGGRAVVVADYEKQEFAPPSFERERYRYVVPKRAPYHDLVLWENGPGKGSDRKRPSDFLEGKVNYRLISASNPCDAHWLRPFLLRKRGRINTPLFVMGPESISGSLKWSEWWGDPALVALFTDYMKAGGLILAIGTGERSSDNFGHLFGEAGYTVAEMEPSGMTPAGGAGAAICEKLSPFAAEDKPRSSRKFIYRKMVVLARPESDPTAAAGLAKRFGKGLFIAFLCDPEDCELAAALALSLADREALREIKRIMEMAGEESTPGASGEAPSIPGLPD